MGQMSMQDRPTLIVFVRVSCVILKLSLRPFKLDRLCAWLSPPIGDKWMNATGVISSSEVNIPHQ